VVPSMTQGSDALPRRRRVADGNRVPLCLQRNSHAKSSAPCDTNMRKPHFADLNGNVAVGSISGGAMFEHDFRNAELSARVRRSAEELRQSSLSSPRLVRRSSDHKPVQSKHPSGRQGDQHQGTCCIEQFQPRPFVRTPRSQNLDDGKRSDITNHEAGAQIVPI
jgi:hypothetical protein